MKGRWPETWLIRGLAEVHIQPEGLAGRQARWVEAPWRTRPVWRKEGPERRAAGESEFWDSA